MVLLCCAFFSPPVRSFLISDFRLVHVPIWTSRWFVYQSGQRKKGTNLTNSQTRKTTSPPQLIIDPSRGTPNKKETSQNGRVGWSGGKWKKNLVRERRLIRSGKSKKKKTNKRPKWKFAKKSSRFFFLFF